ncbi:MAG: ABC transporter substrate-binding protein, partial [Armatimonadota bacterium]
SWTTSPDGRIYRFVLREDLRFHTGRRVTAYDVKLSFERAVNPATRSPNSRLVFDDIVGWEDVQAGRATELRGVRVLDTRTVEITTNFPHRGGDVLQRLGHNAASITAIEVAGKPGNWSEEADAGSGPFRLAEWARNQRIVLQAVAGSRNAPAISRLEFQVIPDASTRVAAYERGDVDLVQLPVEDFLRLNRDPVRAREIRQVPRATTSFFILNPAVYPPARDVRVRRAFAHVINKEQIIRAIFHGVGVPAAGIVPPFVPGHDSQMKGIAYDPAAAQKLLAEAGFPGSRGLPPLEITFNPRGSSGKDVAEVLAAAFQKELGVQTSVSVMEFSRYRTAWFSKNTLAGNFTGWTAAFLDPNYHLGGLLTTGAPSNFANYSNPAYDRLIDEANATTDRRRKLARFQQAERLAMVDDVAVIPIMHPRSLIAIKPYVKGVEVFPLLMGYRPLVTARVER